MLMEEARANKQKNSAAGLVVQPQEDNDVQLNLDGVEPESRGKVYWVESRSYAGPSHIVERAIHEGWKEIGPSTVAPFTEKWLPICASVAADGCLSYYLHYTLSGTGPAVYTIYCRMAAKKKGCKPIQQGAVLMYLQGPCCYTSVLFAIQNVANTGEPDYCLQHEQFLSLLKASGLPQTTIFISHRPGTWPTFP